MHFCIEFLNSLEISGFPSHLLSLKVSASIIILWSLDPPKVTNGTTYGTALVQRCEYSQVASE